LLPEQLEVGNIIRAYHVKLILDKNTQRAKKVIFLLESSRLDTLEKNIPLTVIGADVAPVDLPRWYDVEAIADPVVKDEDFVSVDDAKPLLLYLHSAQERKTSKKKVEYQSVLASDGKQLVDLFMHGAQTLNKFATLIEENIKKWILIRAYTKGETKNMITTIRLTSGSNVRPITDQDDPRILELGKLSKDVKLKIKEHLGRTITGKVVLFPNVGGNTLHFNIEPLFSKYFSFRFH